MEERVNIEELSLISYGYSLRIADEIINKQKIENNLKFENVLEYEKYRRELVKEIILDVDSYTI